MRIREVISSLTALQLNEGPGDVNPAAQNTRAKAKVQGSSKRADIGKRDLAQKERERGDKIRSAGQVSSAGEGDEELARLKAELDTEDEREARSARFAADADRSRRQGTLNPNAGYTNPDAKAGADARADDIGQVGRSGEKRVKDDLRLKNQENRPGHQGGLDAAQKGGDPKHDNAMDELEKEKDASEKERIYTADEVEQMIRSENPLEQQIGTGMLRHNAQVASTGEGADELEAHADAIRRGAPANIPAKPKKDGSAEMSAMGAEAQAKIDAQKKAAKANVTPMSDKAQAAADQKADVRKRNKEGYDDLEHEEKEIAAQTGAARTAREVDELKRAAKEDVVHLSKEQRIQIGNTRREQGIEAAEKLKQQFLGGEGGDLYTKSVKELTDDEVNELATRAQSGSERDTDMLYKRLGLFLMQIAWRNNFKDRQALPDVFGEAKAAMLQALKRWEGKGNFTTWMRKNVEGLLKNYAYADRNVAMDKTMGGKIQQLSKIQQQVKHEGIEGMDADLAVIERMGLNSWDEYDKLKQYASTMNTKSTDMPAGGDEDDAPSVGGEGDAGMQSSFHGDQTDYDMDKQVADLLFYGGEVAPEQTIDALYDRGGIEDDERMIMNKLMGIGGEAPQSVSQLAAETGMKGYAIQKAVKAAMAGMAQAIARENKTNADEELANLEKIFKTRERDHKEAGIARADSFSHEEMQDPEIGDFVRGEEEKRNVIRTAKASQAKRDAAKKEKGKVNESAGDLMRNLLNICK